MVPLLNFVLFVSDEDDLEAILCLRFLKLTILGKNKKVSYINVNKTQYYHLSRSFRFQ